jgi:hypothetical protein
MAMDDTEKSMLDLIKKSEVEYGNVSGYFQKCHDAMVKSGYYSRGEINEIDTCAITFRQLGEDSTSIAKAASGKWIDQMTKFYTNVQHFPKAIIITFANTTLEKLGRQAEDISTAFQDIATRSRDLAGRFHQAQVESVHRSQEFEERYSAAIKDAERRKDEFKQKVLKELELLKGHNIFGINNSKIHWEQTRLKEELEKFDEDIDKEEVSEVIQLSYYQSIGGKGEEGEEPSPLLQG